MHKEINTKWMKCRNEMKCKIWNNEKRKDNNAGDEGAAKISESLMTNTTLTTLNLHGDDNIMKNKQE